MVPWWWLQRGRWGVAAGAAPELCSGLTKGRGLEGEQGSGLVACGRDEILAPLFPKRGLVLPGADAHVGGLRENAHASSGLVAAVAWEQAAEASVAEVVGHEGDAVVQP